MYNVSEAFREAMKKPVQHHSIRGTVGVHQFSESNVLAGSFSITNQCSGTTNVEIGTGYTAELDCTLINLGADRYSFKDEQIIPRFGLITSNGLEEIPLGVFNVSSANHTSIGVDIVAYDNMIKFDKTFSVTTASGTAYAFLSLACEACCVELGNTQQEVSEMPNGSDEVALHEENDIETWRDVVAWIAQMLGGFATIGRDGRLYIRQYDQTAIDNVDDKNRFNGASFSDFETRYTGLSIVEIESQSTKYYALPQDNGLTYNLGQNPFLQIGMPEHLDEQRRRILDALSAIRYVPMDVSMLGTPAYDLGDVITFSDGIADGTKLHCITGYDWTYGAEYSVTGVGSDPSMANARSKTDKNITGLMRQVNGDSEVLKYYEWINADGIHIGDGDSAEIIRFRYVTTKKTRIVFHGEVKYDLDTKEVFEDDAYTEHDGVLNAQYFVNGSLVGECEPVETQLDGTHMMHFMHTWQTSAGVIGDFVVNLKMDGGSVDIGKGWSRAYIVGEGIAGDEAWDGTVKLKDTVEALDVYSLVVGAFTDSVSISHQNVVSRGISDTVNAIDVFAVTIGAFTDKLTQASSLHGFYAGRSTDVSLNDAEYSDGAWRVKSGYTSGTVTTPDCACDRVVKVESAHSSDGVVYIVSFDGGNLWWTYAGGWQQTYSGMTESTMRSLTEQQWAEKLNGTLMVRAMINGSATVTDIEIFTEVIDE